MYFLRLFFILIILLGSKDSWAQKNKSEPTPHPPSLIHELIIAEQHDAVQGGYPLLFLQRGKEEGLPNYIQSIKKDKQGYIWLGTHDGIYRFDGIRFKVFKHDPDDIDGLSSNQITNVFSSRSGQIWATTEDFLLYYFDALLGKFKQLPLIPDGENQAIPIKIKDLLEDSHGTIWLATAEYGLNTLHPTTGKLSHINLYDYLPLDYQTIYTLKEDNTSSIWGIGYNLFRLYFHEDHRQISRGTWFPFLNGNPKIIGGASPIKCLLTSPDHHFLWAAGFDKEIFRIDPIERVTQKFGFDNYDSDRGFSDINAHVNDLYLADNGNIWLANATSGVTIFEPTTTSFVSLRHHQFDSYSLSSDATTEIIGDGMGGIWISTMGGGLNYYHPDLTNFGHFRSIASSKTSLSNNSITSFCEDEQETIWVGTQDGLNKFDRKTGKFQQYFPPSSFSKTRQNKILSIATDHHQNFSKETLWIGSQAGLLTFNADTGNFSKWQATTKTNQALEMDHVAYLTKNKNGILWAVSFLPYRVFRWDTDTRAFQPFELSLQDKTLNDLEKVIADHQQHYWLTTKEGRLYQLDLTSQEVKYFHIQANDSEVFPIHLTQCFWKDRQNRQWVGTSKGLYLLTETQNGSYRFRRFIELDGLLDISIVGILEDQNGFLWLSTHHGLAKLNPETLSFQNYQQAHGLQGDFFSENAFFKSTNNELYFGGNNGFNVFNADSIKNDTIIPPLVITEVAVFRDSNMQEIIPTWVDNHQESPEITLFYGDKLLQIKYAALHYTAPKLNQYAIQLVGYDQDWRYVGNQSEVTYTNLDAGIYHFRVKGSNKDGIWNEVGASMKVIIQPPWWDTWWAYSMYVIITGSVLYFLYAFQLRRKQEQTEALRLKELDEMKSRFFTNVAHELRTPLTLIAGPLQNILKHHEIMPQFQNDLQMIKRNTKQLSNLISEILDLSKMEQKKMSIQETPVELYSLLRRIVAAFGSASTYKKVELHLKYDSQNSIYLKLDVPKFEKVINNLLSNAFKFTSPGGKITLTLNDIDNNIQITVEDTGRGIAAEDLPHVFDRYFQTKKNDQALEGGTGIGLALCKEYLELFGGSISVQSEWKQGSTFILVFPKKEVAAISVSPLATEKILASEDAKPMSKKTVEPQKTHSAAILIVEDNLDMRSYIESILSPLYKCYQAENGQVAWELLTNSNNIKPDLIISDLMMPNMDGFELLKRLKSDSRWRQLPVIMLTARSAKEDRLKALTLGIDDYITKPFDQDELLTRVNNLLQNHFARLQPAHPTKEVLKPEDIKFEPVTSADLKWIQIVAENIKTELSNSELSLLTIANNLAISERHLRRRIKHITGLGAGKYLKEIRLQAARQLLEEKAFLSVAEVSYAVGFRTPNYFSKIYKERFGKLPSDYFTALGDVY